MMAVNADSSEQGGATRAGYLGALVTAGVAGAVALVVSVLLVWHHAAGNLADPLDSPELTALKAELRADPKNEAVKEQIRQKDLQLRRAYFRRQSLASSGRYLLAAAIFVFLVACKWAANSRSKPSMPGPVAHPRPGRAEALARRSVATLGAVLACAGLCLPVLVRGKQPPQRSVGTWAVFRGPRGGISEYTNVPTDWDGKTGRGVLWRTRVPLPGENSPVVWDDRVFLTGATERQREVYCFDAFTGRLLWRQPVRTPASPAEPPEVMEDTGYAAPTVATDGRRVCAIFANGDLACFDFDGRAVWARNLGTPDSAYGYASSLATHEDLLLVQFDQGEAEDGKSRLLGIAWRTGETVWATPRDVGDSWSSPIVADTPHGSQIITCANPWVIAYDPADGREIWRAECLSGDVAPSPVHAGGLAFAVNDGAVLAAIRTDGKGNVTETHVVWTARDDLPDIASPVSDGEFVWVLASYGTLTCYAAKDGRLAWQKHLDASFRSSPTLVGDRIYLLSEKGVMFIIATGGERQQINRCELSEPSNCSPAFLDGRIYIRGKENLYCIGQQQK